jgi:molecular chaperone GrpE
MTADQFRAGLESTGMKRVQAEGSLLDPRCMDAVFKVETSDGAPNTVVAVFEHGYLLNDLVVRPAKVSVAVAPTAPPAAS